MQKDPLYRRHRFPPEVISHCVWLYYRFALSYRDIELMVAERGLTLSYESIRYWCIKFGLAYARKLKASKQWGDTWHLDEVYCRIGGEMMYLWRAVDQDGQTIDLLVQRKRNQQAAARFLRKLRKQSESPRAIVTDKLKSYLKPCKALFADTAHRRDKGANNRAENLHQPTRLREAKMRCFKSIKQAQRFLSNFSTIYDYFRYDQHKTSASTHKILRIKSFECWRTIALNPSVA
jgi:putative transposase